MQHYLEFEKPIAEIEAKASELRAMTQGGPDLDLSTEAERLDERANRLLKDTYTSLNPWQKCQVARHPERPHCRDYVDRLFNEFTALAGDRKYSEDEAMVGGLARFDDEPVVILGHEKGHDTNSRLTHNFGMARPEGYRKAVRLMELADRFSLPVITLVDTPGAYPGKGAEERGQSEAIARSTESCLRIRVPIISVIIGEGGSGGAVAIATADRVAMLEHSIYSVISPEGCASILWKDPEKTRQAAAALKLTAQDLEALGVIDAVIQEPLGGAQRNRNETIDRVGSWISETLATLRKKKPDALLRSRRRKYLGIGPSSGR
ncbi:MAG: acetyl-CoA carboxylase carboxyltransferase subunit alpha [Paracoccaceae bacterium]|nr:acetyl-CoA carboxylase carboxyltransferase subunit alpha [Paracoccaceae bacterium]